MSDLQPRHILCVVGVGLDLDLIENVAVEVGFTLDHEYSELEPDPRMTTAFRACLSNASFTDDDWAAVAAHDSVAYVVSPPMTPEDSLEVSQRMLAVTATLLRTGATAAKHESSGLTHGRDRWLALADAAVDPDPDVRTGVLYRALVKRPVSDGDRLYSCGMHLLAAPEVEVDADGWRTGPGSIDDWVELIDGLALYLLTEQRALEIRDGEGFRLASDAPRWILHRDLSNRYDDDDLFFNPYGCWRLSPA
jgi:hypothetical protein